MAQAEEKETQMKFRPIGPTAIVVLEPADAKSPGVFVLVNATKIRKGEVVAVGPGRMLECGQYEPMGVKKGDQVLVEVYGHNEGRLFKDNGREVMVCERGELIVAIEGE
jgi:chaperonin GroES